MIRRSRNEPSQRLPLRSALMAGQGHFRQIRQTEAPEGAYASDGPDLATRRPRLSCRAVLEDNLSMDAKGGPVHGYTITKAMDGLLDRLSDDRRREQLAHDHLVQLGESHPELLQNEHYRAARLTLIQTPREVQNGN